MQRVLKMKFNVYENAQDFEKKIESFFFVKGNLFIIFFFGVERN